MAKKKGKPGKKPSKRSEHAEADFLPPDLRGMESVMKHLLGGLAGPAPDTPLDQAQEIIYQAFEEPDPNRRLKLAQKAIKTSPDCADGYVLLAELARTPREALELYENGMAAGERAIGKKAFKEYAGDFWGILETRPYMRARQGLAETLWALGRRDEAIQHLQDMLRLNPNDNQGLRYILVAWFLILKRDQDLAQLLQQYADDGTAVWAYSRALLAFRQHGDIPETRKLLKDAKKVNKHVPAYLLGQKQLPLEQPDYVGFGDNNEAVNYVLSYLGPWKDTPGAMAWAREVFKGTKRKRSAPRFQGPLPLVKQRLQRLPREVDVWQADACQLPTWIDVDGEPRHPWAVMVISTTHRLVLAHEILEDQPPVEALWDTVAAAMQEPLMGDPHRPTELQVPAGGPWEELRPHFEEIGVECVPVGELDFLKAMLEELGEYLGGDSQPGLLEVPGVSVEQVGRFFEAAADFYQQAPWRLLGSETAIEVECDRFESGPWYGVVMGQSGMTFGLALYEDLKTLTKLWSGRMSHEENVRKTVALTMTYGSEPDLPMADLKAIEEHGWPVVGPEAYPSIYHKDRGMSMRPPLAWELELMEGCLRAIPEFIKKRKPDDLTKETLTVPVASGPLKLVLSWVDA